MGAGQSKAELNEKVFPNETSISVSPDVVNQLSDRLHSFDVAPERQSSLDAHIRSRIQAELQYLRQEEAHVRQEIEAALEKENLDRETTIADNVDDKTSEVSTKSSATILEDLEQMQSKLSGFNARKQLQQFSQVEKANEAILSCYKSNRITPLDCWQQVKSFKNAVASVEQVRFLA
ncbi:hypothetical protein JOM56_003813 [Amanita muscaria]